MKEMEKMPRDNYKSKNILIDDQEEPKDTNINSIIQSNQIANKSTAADVALNVQDNTIINENSNYFLTTFRQNFLPNIILLSALLLVIIMELIYKNSIFKYSLTYEQNLQNSLPKFLIEFFKIVSICGDGAFIVLGLILIWCYFTLIKTILISVGLIYIVYFHDLLKLIHNDPRPFWQNTILFQEECETSYGNPSGHSLISFYFYLSLSYYLCQINYIKSNIKFKLSVYGIALFISALTAFSRIVLGVHSLDQVLYGSFLGIFAFLIFAFMFKIYDMPLNHYLKFYKVKKYIYVFIISNIVLLILPFIAYSLIDFNRDKKKYELVINKRCPDKDEYQLYSKSCLAESLIILILCGIYSGQFVFWWMISNKKNQLFEDNKDNQNFNKNDDYLTLEESINHWNNQLKNVFKDTKTAIKVFVLLIIILSPGLLYLLVSGENNSLGNILIFKIGLPLFLIGFLSFGPCFHSLINVLRE